MSNTQEHNAMLTPARAPIVDFVINIFSLELSKYTVNKQLLDEVFVIFGIITVKVHVSVISRSQRLTTCKADNII